MFHPLSIFTNIPIHSILDAPPIDTKSPGGYFVGTLTGGDHTGIGGVFYSGRLYP